MRAVPSRRMVVQLEIGAVGYLVGAVAWSFPWLAIAFFLYIVEQAHYLVSIAFFAISLSLIMAGVGCFALGKLYGNWPAVVTGVVNIIAAVLFSVIGILRYTGTFPLWPGYAWYLGFSELLGYVFSAVGMFSWAIAASDITRSVLHRLGTIISLASLVSACIFLLFMLVVFRWAGVGPILFTQPYALAQVLSAVLLHKIGSDIQRKPHDSKQA